MAVFKERKVANRSGSESVCFCVIRYKTISSYLRFGVISAQNHSGPGLLGLDDLAHFSIWDSSAHFIGTTWPISLFFVFRFIVLNSVYKCASKQKMTSIFRQGNREIIRAAS